MNKAESKYRNTALLMDQALLILLEKKDLEFITIKEICAKAGVNRSTFYLHYENINDLLRETIEYLNKEFLSSFPIKDINNKIKDRKLEEVLFIKEEFLVPYLEFVKKHMKVMKTIHSKPFIFNNERVYNKMKNEIFIPIIEKFNVYKQEQPYILEFFTRGVTGIVGEWLVCDCKDPIDNIVTIILKCVKY